jgi:hypothetical protein
VSGRTNQWTGRPHTKDPPVNDRPRLSPEARKWMPAAAAAGVLAIVVVAGVALGGGGGDSTSEAPAGTIEPASVVSVPASVAVIETIETSSPVTKSQLTRTLAKGWPATTSLPCSSA